MKFIYLKLVSYLLQIIRYFLIKMIVSRKVFFNILIKKGQSYLIIINRFIGKSGIIFNESNVLHNVKVKKKIVPVKKKLSKDNQTTVIEWKSAAKVIKNLNVEYKYLYGPTNASDEKLPHDLTDDLKNRIIQHETRIPIIEPSADYEDNKNDKIDLSSILTFPLVNKCAYSDDKINELNFLRKRLEMFCKSSAVPSVTSILQATMPEENREILNKWKQNMINQMGQEEFEKYQSAIFTNGASLHQSICSFLVSTPESELHIKKENVGHWMSLKHILPNIKDVKLLEEFVSHPFLCYRGIVDCFAKYKERLVVIDWKTSKKSKANIKNTYDDPLQIAAYVGALNFDPRYQYLATKGLIVIAYENGMPATSHFIDESTMEHYWNEWLKRVKQFWEMKMSESETHK